MSRPGRFFRAPACAVAVIVAALASGSSAVAQRCNPVIDGTYCAENMPKRSVQPRSPSQPSSKMQPIQPIQDPSSAYQDTPGTLGGIQFGNTGTNCVGLMRRSNCK